MITGIIQSGGVSGELENYFLGVVRNKSNTRNFPLVIYVPISSYFKCMLTVFPRNEMNNPIDCKQVV